MLNSMSFSIFKCRLEITFSFVLIICSMIILNDPINITWSILAVFIHELGHIIYMCILHTPPDHITFTAFSIDISDKFSHTRNNTKNIFLALAGPLANFIATIIFYTLSIIFNNTFYLPAAINLLIGCFNLLPIISLDGYQIVHTILSTKFTPKTTCYITNCLSVIVLLPVLIFGFILEFRAKYNFSLLIVSLYLITALILSRT